MPIHRSHPGHELSLTNRTKPYTCDGCKMDGHGERFRCREFCDYDLHKECMHPSETLALDAFQGHTFKFLNQPPPGPNCARCSSSTYCGSCRACDLCGMTVEGFVYHCREGGNGGLGLDAHPRCAMLKKKIEADGVVFQLRSDILAKCNCCKRKQLKGTVKKVPGFSYVSQCKKYSFHVYCLMGMGLEHGASSSDSYDGVGQEVVNPDRRLQRHVRSGASKVVKVVKLFLKIVLSVLFGDPTAILASVVVELLTS